MTAAWRERPRTGQAVDATLELHLVPTTAVRIAATSLTGICTGIVRQARANGLFEETAGVRTSVDEDGATVELDGRETAGVRVRPDGSVIVWTALPRDSLGVVLDQADLTARLTVALRVAGALYAQRAAAVAFAVGLDGLLMASEDDVREVGRRTSVRPSMIQDPIRVEPTDGVSSGSLDSATPEIAAELATRIMLRFRKRRL
jgi:hypothetical protein